MISATDAKMYTKITRNLEEIERKNEKPVTFEECLIEYTTNLDILMDNIIDAAAICGSDKINFFFDVEAFAADYEGDFPWTDEEVIEQLISLLGEYGFNVTIKNQKPICDYSFYDLQVDWS